MRIAARQPSAVTLRLAQNVTISTSPITRVAIATARSAKALRRRTGCRRVWKDLLPVQYFHVVFTLPPQIADIAYQNKEAVYGLLFKASVQTLQTIAADPKHLGAKIGMTSVLHTWGSAMTHHPHVHVVVPPFRQIALQSPAGQWAAACHPTVSVGSPAAKGFSCR